MNVAVDNLSPSNAQSRYVLKQALEPLERFLSDPSVIEISVNGPGTVYIERAGVPEMELHVVEALTRDRIRSIAEAVAGFTSQYVNRENPLLSAGLPTGERVQVVLAPAAASGGAISIRKQVVSNMTLETYRDTGALSGVKISDSGVSDVDRRLIKLLKEGDFYSAIKMAIESRVTILISGGTGVGKTSFMNGLLRSVPLSERIITLEDTPELTPPQHNVVSLLASRGGQSVARVTMQDSLEASLRMRPDRLFVGEVRGREVFSFIQAVNTGHPGSMSTVHADSPQAAYERLAFMVMESGMAPTLSKGELISYIKSVIPMVIQLRRVDGQRKVSEIYFARYDDA